MFSGLTIEFRLVGFTVGQPTKHAYNTTPLSSAILFSTQELTDNWKGEGFVSSGELNQWGMNGRNDVCTANAYYGCDRVGNPSNIINPVMSARLRSLQDFSFKYGLLILFFWNLNLSIDIIINLEVQF